MAKITSVYVERQQTSGSRGGNNYEAVHAIQHVLNIATC